MWRKKLIKDNFNIDQGIELTVKIIAYVMFGLTKKSFLKVFCQSTLIRIFFYLYIQLLTQD